MENVDQHNGYGPLNIEVRSHASSNNTSEYQRRRHSQQNYTNSPSSQNGSAFSPISPSSSTSSSAYFSDSQQNSVSSVTSSATILLDTPRKSRESCTPYAIDFQMRRPSFPKSKFLRKAQQLRRDREKSCEKEKTPICVEQEGRRIFGKEVEVDDEEEEEYTDEEEYEEVIDDDDEEKSHGFGGIQVKITRYDDDANLGKRVELEVKEAIEHAIKQEESDVEDIFDEDSEDGEEEEEDYSSTNGFLSDRSTSVSRSTSVTLCLPAPNGELPPISSGTSSHFHHPSHQRFIRNSLSPVEKRFPLVVDEVHFTFRLFKVK